MKELIRKTREYLDYIEEHYDNVLKSWEILQAKCKDMKFVYDDYLYNWIGSEIIEHDISKLSEYEFVQYRKKFFPCEKEQINESLFEDAWKHHKCNNLHHWQNWTTMSMCNPNEWEVHCVCMVCDWMAMGMKFNDTAQAYYERNKDKISIPQWAEDYMYEIFKRIAC